MQGISQVTPDLLGHERRERMEQTQGHIKYACQSIRRTSCTRTTLRKFLLGNFYIPICEVSPDEIINLLSGLPILKRLEKTFHITDELLQARPDPTIS